MPCLFVFMLANEHAVCRNGQPWYWRWIRKVREGGEMVTRVRRNMKVMEVDVGSGHSLKLPCLRTWALS